jgi:hypothetical protein
VAPGAQARACTLVGATQGRSTRSAIVEAPARVPTAPERAAALGAHTRQDDAAGRTASRAVLQRQPARWPLAGPGARQAQDCSAVPADSAHELLGRPCAHSASERARSGAPRCCAAVARGMRAPRLLCAALLLLLAAALGQAAGAAQPPGGAPWLAVQWEPELSHRLEPGAEPGGALRAGSIVAEGALDRRRRLLRRAAALPRRALLASADVQARADELDRQAGAVAASLLDAVHIGLGAAEGHPAAAAAGAAGAPAAAPTLSGLVANSLDAVNRRAPVIRMPDGYSVRPQARPGGRSHPCCTLALRWLGCDALGTHAVFQAGLWAAVLQGCGGLAPGVLRQYCRQRVSVRR